MDGDFGNIIGFLIFAAIAVMSIVGKIREQRKTGEQEHEQAPEEEEPSLDELPELVRRMIRGSVEPEPEHRETERPKTVVEPSPIPKQTVRPVVEEVRRDWSVDKTPVTPPPVPPERWEGPYEPPVQPPRQSKRIRRQQQEAAKVIKTPPPAPKPPLTPKKPLQPRRSTGSMRLAKLFSDKNRVRNGILYQEILGPPKALRDRPE